MSAIEAEHQTAVSSNRTVRGVCFGFAVCAIAAVIPIVVASALHPLFIRGIGSEVLTVGALAGLAVGQLAAFRRRSLQAFVFGPAIGFAAGMLDLHVFLWLYTTLELPLMVAAFLPVWGLALGAWVAMSHLTSRSRLWVVMVIAGADFAARIAWSAIMLFGILDDLSSTPLAALEAITYSPACVMIVYLIRPFKSPAKSKLAAC